MSDFGNIIHPNYDKDRTLEEIIEDRIHNNNGERFELQLAVTTHFLVDLGFAHDDRGVKTLRVLRELITDLIRLHEPDTLNVRLTTGDNPLDLSQQATVLVIESSSKTGNSFPVDPANLQFSSADTSIATVTANGDGTATVTPVAVGSTTISGQATVVVTTVTPDQPDILQVIISDPFPAGTSGNAPKTATGAKPV
jgi:hypothetical protein